MADETTMDGLAVGAVFNFAGAPTSHPGFVKISNLYAKNLLDGQVRPNATNAQEAAQIRVVYLGREDTAALEEHRQ